MNPSKQVKSRHQRHALTFFEETFWPWITLCRFKTSGPLIKAIPTARYCFCCKNKSKKTHALEKTEIVRLREEDEIYLDPDYRWRICSSCGENGTVKVQSRLQPEEIALDKTRLFKMLLLMTKESKKAKLEMPIKDETPPWWSLEAISDKQCQELVFMKVTYDNFLKNVCTEILNGNWWQKIPNLSNFLCDLSNIFRCVTQPFRLLPAQ